MARDPLKLSTASQVVPFMMIDSADHVTGKTGLTVTVTIGKNGAALGALGGSVAELSGGWYKATLNATDTNTFGPIAFHCTASGADPTDFVETVGTVWDQILTGGTYNVPNSAGRHLRGAGGGTSGVALSGTLQSGTTTSVTLPASGTSSQNDAYKGWTLVSTGGAGLFQTARLVSYNGSSKVAVLDRVVPVAFSGTTTFDLYVGSSSLAVEEGVSQAGDGTTITARSGASTVNDAYTGWQAVLTSGTPDYGEITDYVGATRVATVAWAGAGASAAQNYAFFPPAATAQDSGGGTTSPTATEIVGELMATLVESTLSFQSALKLLIAYGNKLSGAGTATEVFRDYADTLNRISATVDAAGNRTAITRDLS